VQFPPGVAILPVCAVYSKRGQSSSWAGGREAEHDRQSGVPDGGTTACLCRLGPHSAVARGRESRAAGKRELAAAAHRGAAPLAISPGPQDSCRELSKRACRTAAPGPDMALGQRVPPLAQANQSPPESTTERSQL
jgi:hypothetical protein